MYIPYELDYHKDTSFMFIFVGIISESAFFLRKILIFFAVNVLCS